MADLQQHITGMMISLLTRMAEMSDGKSAMFRVVLQKPNDVDANSLLSVSFNFDSDNHYGYELGRMFRRHGDRARTWCQPHCVVLRDEVVFFDSSDIPFIEREVPDVRQVSLDLSLPAVNVTTLDLKFLVDDHDAVTEVTGTSTIYVIKYSEGGRCAD